ncbi:MAG TPA: EamA family transporter [Burkholderiales bacterium]|nr:EamA family transporter [Burkholderiales bacterium]
MSTVREIRRAVIVMVVLVILWGYSWITAKIGLNYASPMDVVALRLELGILTLFIGLIWTGRPLKPQHWQALLMIGLIQTGAFLLLNTWALSEGGPGKTSVLVFTMPFWVLVFAWPMLHERIRGLQWLCVVLAIVGLLFVLEPWQMHTSLFSKTLAVLAGMCWAIGVVYAKRLHNRVKVEPLSFTFWQMIVGMIPVLLCQALLDRPPIVWSNTFVVVTLFNGVMATGIGWLAWLYVLHRLPAGTTSLASLGIPVIAIFSSWIQLGEQPGRSELIGMLLIGVALALLSYLSIRRHEEPEPMTGQE